MKMMKYKNQKIMDDIEAKFDKYEAELAIKILSWVEDENITKTSQDYNKLVNNIYSKRTEVKK